MPTERVRDELHVVPSNDLIEHDLARTCVCGPISELLESAWLVTHHSLDNREADEHPY